MSVAIIGGGIGGLALALALWRRDIPCKVFEKDASFDSRRQGYGLTLQQGKPTASAPETRSRADKMQTRPPRTDETDNVSMPYKLFVRSRKRRGHIELACLVRLGSIDADWRPAH